MLFCAGDGKHNHEIGKSEIHLYQKCNSLFSQKNHKLCGNLLNDESDELDIVRSSILCAFFWDRPGYLIDFFGYCIKLFYYTIVYYTLYFAVFPTIDRTSLFLLITFWKPLITNHTEGFETNSFSVTLIIQSKLGAYT